MVAVVFCSLDILRLCQLGSTQYEVELDVVMMVHNSLDIHRIVLEHNVLVA